MYELVYAGAEVEKIILNRFPTAKITDASDYIHTERFEAQIDDVSEDEFYLFALKEGFALCCFHFNLMTYRKEDQARILKWIDIAKKDQLRENV